MTNQTTTPQNGTNAGTFNDFMKDVKKFGREAAAGLDALPKLGYAVARAVATGALDPNEKDEHGNDQFHQAYHAYAAEQSSKAVHTHSQNGVKANASKLRQIGMAAAMPTCDFVSVLNRLMPKRNELAKAGDKVKAAYPAMVDAARTQRERDVDLTDDEIEAACRKKESEDKTVLKELQSIEKKLEKLITGEGELQDQSDQVIAAHEQIRQRVQAITMMERKAALRAEMEELGWEFVETQLVEQAA